MLASRLYLEKQPILCENLLLPRARSFNPRLTREVVATPLTVFPGRSKERFFFIKNHPGHGDQGWTNLSNLGPYTSIDEPLFMAMKIPASVAPVFLDEICLISLI